MGGCGSKDNDELNLVNVETAAQPEQGAGPAVVDTGPVSAPENSNTRKFSERKRRRVAVASENSEMVAQLRWKSAFDAVRKEEFKLPQHILKIKEKLSEHPILGKLDPDIIDQVTNAMRVEKVKNGDLVIKAGEAGDAFYVVGEGDFAAYVRTEAPCGWLRHTPRLWPSAAHEGYAHACAMTRAFVRPARAHCACASRWAYAARRPRKDRTGDDILIWRSVWRAGAAVRRATRGHSQGDIARVALQARPHALPQPRLHCS